jgi:phosphate transport system protein
MAFMVHSSKLKRFEPQHDLMERAAKACLIAQDAIHNLIDLLSGSSRIAYLALRDCENELDQIEREIDEELPGAITQVNETTARELLACLKFITDLERIGDLTSWVGSRIHALPHPLPGRESKGLIEMAGIVHQMVQQVHQGFVGRDARSAQAVLHADLRINHIYHSLFQRHLGAKLEDEKKESLSILLMAQALERAGDHAKNLAEELVHMVEGRSIRHPPKRRARD